MRAAAQRRALLLEHVLQRPGQVLDDRVQDALVLLLGLIAAARRDGLLGPRQAALRVGLQGGLGLGLALLLLLDAVLWGQGGVRGLLPAEWDPRCAAGLGERQRRLREAAPKATRPRKEREVLTQEGAWRGGDTPPRVGRPGLGARPSGELQGEGRRSLSGGQCPALSRSASLGKRCCPWSGLGCITGAA